jgi:translation initiation factor IF-3
MDTVAALDLARQRGFDLVEVSPNARPPVCKILDFGAFIFRQEKQERKARAGQKKVDIKGIRLTFRIGQHDKETRHHQALKFLDEGHKVMLEMRLRGRENAFSQLAQKHMQEFIALFGNQIVTEQPVSRLGNRLTAIIGKKK